MDRLTAPAPASVTLKCHHCARAVGVSAVDMQFVGVFHPRRLAAVVPAGHAQERRIRCRYCCWVNVFHPVPPSREVVLK